MHFSRLIGASLAVCSTALILACGSDNTESITTPNDQRSPADETSLAVSDNPKFWNSGASLAWNATARAVLAATGAAPFVQMRVLAYLSVAQYDAVVAAERTVEHGDHASVPVAAGAASLVVLKYLFPAQAAAFDQQFAAHLAATPWPGAKNGDAAAGEVIGRAIGAAMVTRASTDGLFSQVPTPKGPGLYYWRSSLTPPAPAALFLYGVRSFALTSAGQFRPEAPPALESTEFQTALAEVRTISDARTAEQIAIAQRWATRGPVYWNSEAAAMIVAHRQSERKAAHTLALANMAGFDATIACWDAKFEYWTARPTTVDPAITLAVPLPNFPSYPSGHSCISGAFVTVLSTVFPEETLGLEEQLDEVALARIYGGLHYRFDCDAGQELGRKVADYVIGQDVSGHEPIALNN